VAAGPLPVPCLGCGRPGPGKAGAARPEGGSGAGAERPGAGRTGGASPLRSGACGARRPAQTAPTRGKAPATGRRPPRAAGTSMGDGPHAGRSRHAGGVMMRGTVPGCPWRSAPMSPTTPAGRCTCGLDAAKPGASPCSTTRWRRLPRRAGKGAACTILGGLSRRMCGANCARQTAARQGRPAGASRARFLALLRRLIARPAGLAGASQAESYPDGRAGKEGPPSTIRAKVVTGRCRQPLRYQDASRPLNTRMENGRASRGSTPSASGRVESAHR